MWLPKDERRILAGLSCLLRGPACSERYECWELAKILRWRGWRGVKEYGKTVAKGVEGVTKVDMEKRKKENKRLLSEDQRVQQSLHNLEKYKLIVTKPKNEADRCFIELTNLSCIELTVAGYDLGRRYASLLGWIGLWVREYRWIWGGITFLLGALVDRFLGSFISFVVR